MIDNPFAVIDRRINRLESLLIEIRDTISTPAPATTLADAAPIMSAAEVKKMTGWPDGTFYAKTNQMPPGVVIRGKSRRLLFDRELFLKWLKTPVQP